MARKDNTAEVISLSEKEIKSLVSQAVRQGRPMGRFFSMFFKKPDGDRQTINVPDVCLKGADLEKIKGEARAVIMTGAVPA